MLTLAITTFNSAEFIEPVLRSIDSAIPRDIVRAKIAIDDRSTDGTREILKRYCWTVYYNTGGGVASAWNQITRLVKSEYFATFEHDLILNPAWLKSVAQEIYQDRFCCVQGVRLSTNWILNRIERAKGEYKKTRSLDNNLFLTAAARRFRFPDELKYAADRYLFRQVQDADLKWIVKPDVVSAHIRPTFKADKDHDEFMMLRAQVPQSTDQGRDFIKMGTRNALKVLTRAPGVTPFYLYGCLRTFRTWNKRQQKLKHAALTV